MKSDWQKSSHIQSLSLRLSQQDRVTALVKEVSGLDKVIRAWVKHDALCVVLAENVWSLPIKDQLFLCLPKLIEQLGCQLNNVKVKRDLQK